MRYGAHATGYRKHHRDANHGEVQKELEQLGASVCDLSKVGDDFPDLLVGFCGRDFKVEIKAAKGEQSDGQKEFARDWRSSPVVVIRSRLEVREWYLRLRHELTRQAPVKALAALRTVHRDG
jgi:hypothetical protein